MAEAYYNEHDPAAAAWLRELMKADLIAPGVVDSRDIQTLRNYDLGRFTQVHLFAGIGGWSYALRLAGWPDDRSVWTGSCPCQPFSVAGKKKGKKDERHLWPWMRHLMFRWRPAIAFGEQVASKDGREWLAGVRANLETLGYVVGAADLCAAGVASPHIRQRLYWVADARLASTRRHPEPGIHHAPAGGIEAKRQRQAPTQLARGGATGGMAHAAAGGFGIDGGASGSPGHTHQRGPAGGLGESFQSRLEGLTGHGDGRGQPGRVVAGSDRPTAETGAACRLADPKRERCREGGATGRRGSDGDGDGLMVGPAAQDASPDGFWSAFDLIPCRDGKARRVPQSGVLALADGLSADVDHLRLASNGHPLTQAKIKGRRALLAGAGNAIVPQLAAQFISAFLNVPQDNRGHENHQRRRLHLSGGRRGL